MRGSRLVALLVLSGAGGAALAGLLLATGARCGPDCGLGELPFWYAARWAFAAAVALGAAGTVLLAWSSRRTAGA